MTRNYQETTRKMKEETLGTSQLEKTQDITNHMQ